MKNLKNKKILFILVAFLFCLFVFSNFSFATSENKNLPSIDNLIVDDNINNCKGAMELGIYGVLLCRDKFSYIANKILSINKKYSVINNLEDLSRIQRFYEE